MGTKHESVLLWHEHTTRGEDSRHRQEELRSPTRCHRARFGPEETDLREHVKVRSLQVGACRCEAVQLGSAQGVGLLSRTHNMWVFVRSHCQHILELFTIGCVMFMRFCYGCSLSVFYLSYFVTRNGLKVIF